ncbi:hypothetical protein C2142_37840 [Streptomyces sp. CB01881]|nr:hypothetical protein C2142_37840 [Streptomyces sp. CB01881]
MWPWARVASLTSRGQGSPFVSTTVDRWAWLVIAAHTQLSLARPLVADLRHSRERPAEPNRLTPARVRRR